MGKSTCAILAVLLILTACGSGVDLIELEADPMAHLELVGASVADRYELNSGGSMMNKPTRASVTTVYAIDEEADPETVYDAAVEAAREAGWNLEEHPDQVNPGQSLVTGTKELASGEAELAINFRGEFVDGEPVVDRSELIVIVQHEWRR